MTNEEIENPNEDDFDDQYFEPCTDCDLPDACADFECAIKAGLRKPKIGSTQWDY